MTQYHEALLAHNLSSKPQVILTAVSSKPTLSDRRSALRIVPSLTSYLADYTLYSTQQYLDPTGRYDLALN